MDSKRLKTYWSHHSYFFFVRDTDFINVSVRTILPGIIDFQVCLDEGSQMQPLSYLSIRCHDLCKLMHFGSSKVKLIASFCLLELFTGISDHTNGKPFDLKFREGYIMSVSSTLEGLIFFDDIRVALNCSLCLSALIKWKSESMFDNWCRLIVEELVMCLSTPTLTNSFAIHHRPTANVAVALLKVTKGPPWMTKAFDDSSMQSIIKNVSANNLSIELVILFRELMTSGYLTSAHVAHLNRVFQVRSFCSLFFMG